MYYDPRPLPPGDPWYEPDAVTAYQRTRALMGAGAGLANYVGHSHHWQWAVTDLAASPPYLLGMYDVDVLGNDGRLPILLEMTCLTSAFQQPAFSGTTIDERFILQRGGGAVAVCGSHRARFDARSRCAATRFLHGAVAGEAGYRTAWGANECRVPGAVQSWQRPGYAAHLPPAWRSADAGSHLRQSAPLSAAFCTLLRGQRCSATWLNPPVGRLVWLK